MNKAQLVLYMAIVFFAFPHFNIIHAQGNDIDQKVVELKPLRINHQIDLSKIFKRPAKPVEEKTETDPVTPSKQPISVHLVGTLILGEKKLAWLKVENQVYQLESGQSIPGTHRRISQINPESVVLIHAQPCKVEDSCALSQTLTIRDALF